MKSISYFLWYFITIYKLKIKFKWIFRTVRLTRVWYRRQGRQGRSGLKNFSFSEMAASSIFWPIKLNLTRNRSRKNKEVVKEEWLPMSMRMLKRITHSLTRTTIRKRSPLRSAMFKKEVLAQIARILLRMPKMRPKSSVPPILSPSKVRQVSTSHMICLARQSQRPSTVTTKLLIILL